MQRQSCKLTLSGRSTTVSAIPLGVPAARRLAQFWSACMQVKSHDLLRDVGPGLPTAELVLLVDNSTIAQLTCSVHGVSTCWFAGG